MFNENSDINCKLIDKIKKIEDMKKMDISKLKKNERMEKGVMGRFIF